MCETVSDPFSKDQSALPWAHEGRLLQGLKGGCTCVHSETRFAFSEGLVDVPVTSPPRVNSVVHPVKDPKRSLRTTTFGTSPEPTWQFLVFNLRARIG